MSCSNTSFSNLHNTWSEKSDLHYGHWTPYGSDGCGTSHSTNFTKESFSNSSKNNLKKSNRFHYNTVIAETYTIYNNGNSLNYATLNTTWKKQNPFST
jgi:hypothetical protein